MKPSHSAWPAGVALKIALAAHSYNLENRRASCLQRTLATRATDLSLSLYGTCHFPLPRVDVLRVLLQVCAFPPRSALSGSSLLLRAAAAARLRRVCAAPTASLRIGLVDRR